LLSSLGTLRAKRPCFPRDHVIDLLGPHLHAAIKFQLTGRDKGRDKEKSQDAAQTGLPKIATFHKKERGFQVKLPLSAHDIDRLSSKNVQEVYQGHLSSFQFSHPETLLVLTFQVPFEASAQDTKYKTVKVEDRSTHHRILHIFKIKLKVEAKL
jgi:hypothetical protein